MVENQLIHIFIDGLYFDYLKKKVLRDDPGTYQAAIQSVMREKNIRKRFTLRKDDEPRDNQRPRANFNIGARREAPMEVYH